MMMFNNKNKQKKEISERIQKLRMENLEMLEQAIPGSEEYNRLLANLEKFEEMDRKKDELQIRRKEAGIQYVIPTIIKAITHGVLGKNLIDFDNANPIAGKVENKVIDKIFKFMD